MIWVFYQSITEVLNEEEGREETYSQIFKVDLEIHKY